MPAWFPFNRQTRQTNFLYASWTNQINGINGFPS